MKSIPFYPELAKQFGVTASLVLSLIYSHANTPRRVLGMSELLEFLSAPTIYRATDELVFWGLLKFENKKDSKIYSRYFSLTDKGLNLLKEAWV